MLAKMVLKYKWFQLESRSNGVLNEPSRTVMGQRLDWLDDRFDTQEEAMLALVEFLQKKHNTKQIDPWMLSQQYILVQVPSIVDL